MPTLLEQFRLHIEDARRIIERNWAIEDVAVDSVNPVHVANNIWQRSLAFISGWDYSSLQRRKIAVDTTGRVLVSFAAGGGITPSFAVTTVALAATLLSAANPDRAYLIIENIGTNNVWLRHDNAVAINNGYQLPPGSVLKLDNWSQALWGVGVVAAQDVCIVER